MPDILEAEVVEIDGVTPPPPKTPVQDQPPLGRKFPGGFTFQLRGFDRRWWPLWVIGGLFLSVFILAGLLIAAVVFFVSKLIGLLLSPFRAPSRRPAADNFFPIRRE